MPVKSADCLTKLYIAIARAWGVPEHQARIFARAILTGDPVSWLLSSWHIGSLFPSSG